MRDRMNVPVKKSTPSEEFKSFLHRHAQKGCSKCKSTGYIGKYKGIEDGRCFNCFPDNFWRNLLFTVEHAANNNDKNALHDLIILRKLKIL